MCIARSSWHYHHIEIDVERDMSNYGAVTLGQIEEASKVDVLDDALRPVMEAAGITDGGFADMCLGDYNETWHKIGQPRRASLIFNWLRAEWELHRAQTECE